MTWFKFVQVKMFGGVAEWLKATDCKSVLSEYAGSNPAPTTIFLVKCFYSGWEMLIVFLAAIAEKQALPWAQAC